MKKIFSFLVLFLLSSYMATDVLAQDPPYPVKFSDDVDTYPYYIGFLRQQPNHKYWTVDHTVSGTISQETLRPEGEEAIQQWKFILVGDDEPGVFYIMNVKHEEYVAYHAGGAPITDSYGMPIPVGSGREAQDVYYTDKGILEPCKFTLEYRADISVHGFEGGWVLMDKADRSMNERGGYNICRYSPDTGNTLTFVVAETPEIELPSTSLTLGSLVNKKTEYRISVNGRFLKEDIEVSLEGPDAGLFSHEEADNFRSGLIKVAFTPTELRAHSATLKLKSGDVEALLPLTGNVYPDSDLPEISDGDNETWYFIKFLYDQADNLVWTSNGGSGHITREAIPAGAFDDRQLWKIVGNWDEGYYFVNKDQGELKYNQSLVKEEGPIVKELVYDGAVSGGPDIYFAWGEDSGYGDYFNFVKDKNGYWQLFNRDVNSAPTSTARKTDGYDARYVYARHLTEGFPLTIRQSAENSERTQIVFVKAESKIVVAGNTTTFLMKALAGEEAELEITVTGVDTRANISAAITGDEVFTLAESTLPAAGGKFKVYFNPTDNEKFYKATLTLSSEGAEDVQLSLTGSYGGPLFSLEDDIWHVLQFTRRTSNNYVWTSKGTGELVKQELRDDTKRSQHWRFVGTPDGFIIENREGGQMAFVGSSDARIYAENGDTYRYHETTDITNVTRDNSGVNDRGSSTICLYGGAGTSDNAMSFYPIEYEEVGRKIIIASSSAVALTAQTGKTATATVEVSTIGVTGDVTATLEGEGFSIDVSSVPAAGDVITITFAPTEADKDYSATLTLSNAEAVDKVVISITGTTPPVFSNDGNEAWYYIQFERPLSKGNNVVWQGNGIDQDVTQEPFVKDQKNQHWKLVGEWNDEFKIVNREGGEIFFPGIQESGTHEGKVGGFATLTEDGYGDGMAFVPESTKWAFWIFTYFFAEDSWGCLNDFNGDSEDVGIYTTGDPGSYVIFTPIAKMGEGINNPGFDPNDQVVATKYYNLQGMEVKAPTTTGVYIVKYTYASGRTQAFKEVRVVK